MELKRCENGHFYDAERFPQGCPHCNQPSVSTVDIGTSGEKQYTKPLSSITGGDTQDGNTVTIGYFGEMVTDPVVGWLVAIAGNNLGADYRLKSGRNFIGRSPKMDVDLSGDISVSRDRHAVILYEPKSNVFLVQPGDAKELFYLNDDVVLTATEIHAYDVLTLGSTKLLFIPCCSDRFNWDSVKAENEEKEEKGKEK